MTSLAYNSATQYLFNRRYSLEIVPFGQTVGTIYGNENNNAANLRVQFDVDRSFASAADKAKITIFNLTTSNRNRITRGCVVRLRAGYESRTKLIFSGIVRKVQTDQNGPDTVTSMECGDGEPNYQYATVNRSYSTSVPLARVLQDIASDLELSIGGNVVDIAPGVIRGIPNEDVYAGTVFEGTVKNVLNLLLKTRYIDWSIHNNTLVILPAYSGLYAAVEVVSKQTGLVGAPSFTERYVKFDALLNIALLPGAYVQLISDNRLLSGFYRLRTVKIAGDTHETPWGVSCEAELLKQPLPVDPTAIGGNFNTAVVKP